MYTSTHVTMKIYIKRDASDIVSKDLTKMNMRPKLCRPPYADQQTNTIV